MPASSHETNVLRKLTRISDSDLDSSPLKAGSIKSQCLFEAIDSSEFSIGESFGTLLNSVFDNANASDFAITEKVVYTLTCCFVGEVTKMGGVRRLCRKLSRERVTRRIGYFKLRLY